MATLAPVGLLQLFGGEVLAQFDQQNKLLAATRVKTVSGGALSWQFPNIGAGTAKYHTPGENIISTSGYTSANDGLRSAARTVYADKVMTCSALIDKFQMVLDSFDSRSEYAKQLGLALAKRMDQNIMAVLTQASTRTRLGAAAATPTSPGNANVNGAILAAAASADNLVSALYEAQARLNARDVPEEDRYCAMGPSQYKLLFASADATAGSLQWANTQFAPAAATGRIPMLAGFNILMTNSFGKTAADDTNLADADTSLTGASTNDYTIAANPWGGSYTIASMQALCFHSSAVGTVKVQDVSVESEYKMEYLADLVLAKLGVGHGILRNESAVAIVV